MELRVAACARRRALRSSKANNLVTVGAAAKPLGVFGRHVVVVCPPSLIANLLGNAPPRRTVSGSGSRNRVGDLVEENLVDVVILSHLGQIA